MNSRNGKPSRTTKGRKARRIDLEHSRLVKEAPPRIEPGKYDAICHQVDTGICWGGRRSIYIRFRIQGGTNHGKRIYMVCTYPKGEITTRYKYYEQWCLAMGRRPSRGERLSRSAFKNKLYKVLVRDTNKKFSNGGSKPEFLQYSVVDTIIETQTGISTVGV